MGTRQSVLLDAVARGGWIQSVAINDVVAHDGVIINDRSGKWTVVITIADQYSTVVVVKDGVVRDRHLIRSVPRMNAPTFAAVHHVVPNVATQVGMIDPVVELVRRVDVPNVVHCIADNVVVVPAVVVVIIDAAAIYASGGVMTEVMDVVADNADVRGVVNDAVASRSVIAGNVEALDVDVVSLIRPNDIDRSGPDGSAPLCVGDETDKRRSRAAGLCGDRAGVGAWSYVYGRSRLRHVGCTLNSCPGTLLGAAVGIIP